MSTEKVFHFETMQFHVGKEKQDIAWMPDVSLLTRHHPKYFLTVTRQLADLACQKGENRN